MNTAVPMTAPPGWAGASRSPLVLLLIALLAAQLVLALVLGSLGGSLAPSAGDRLLVPIPADQFTAIEIGDGNGTLKLDRTSAGWVLPELGNFPVSPTRIEQTLADLTALRRPLPIATTAAAHKRFKVEDDHPERRLTLRGNAGAETVLLLGDSPGFRRVFARVAGEDGVYELRLGLADLPARADDWIDRGKLRLERGRIERVAGPGWTLVKQGDTWALEGQTGAPASAAVDEVLNALGALGYSGVLGTEDKPEYRLDTPALTLTVGLSGGEQHRYVVGALGEGPDQVLKADDQPWYFRVADYDLGALKTMTLERLLGRETAPARPEPAAGEQSAPPEGTGVDAPTPPADSQGSPVPATDTGPAAAPAPAAEVAPMTPTPETGIGAHPVESADGPD